jgi:HD superfamily phosphohydrolase
VPKTERVRDPIHEFVYLSGDEWRAVDTPVFQRLRRVGQLAMTYLVYPGARHTRFEHSIGVRHIAWRLCAQLNIGDEGEREEERRPVLHAALLHDLGHGPFSHVSEQVLDQVSGATKVHEAISVALIRTDADLREALGAENCDAAAELLEGGRQSVEHDIIDGSTDADKLDYLLRDTYFAGVEFGRYDLPRLVETARVVGTPETQTFLGFDIGGLWAVEALFLARHHMWRAVYGHKTRLATDIMITRALLAGIEQGTLRSDAFTVPTDGDGEPQPTPEFLGAFLEQTDSSVVEQLRTAEEGSPARDLIDRLCERRLLRQTETIALHRDQERLDPVRRSELLDPEQFTEEQTDAIEEQIVNELGIERHLVAVYIDRWSNPTYRRPGGGGVGRVQLLDGTRATYLDVESEIFRRELGEDQAYLHLYMPEVSGDQARRARELLWQTLTNA